MQIHEDNGGRRLDRFLSEEVGDVPPSAIQRWIRTGQVRVNGGRVRGGLRLNVGDVVRLPPMYSSCQIQKKQKNREKNRERSPPKQMIAMLKEQVLYQDDAFLLLNKPSGWAVHGGSGQLWGVSTLLKYLWEKGEYSGVNAPPTLCHRLDKGTSGCLLIGMTSPVVRKLTEAFREGVVEKCYLALVHGSLDQNQGVMKDSLKKGRGHSGERVMAANREEGRSARTRYRVLTCFPEASLSLVKLYPETGRTHQIRVHLQLLGHPIAGDEKYGDRLLNRLLRKKLGLKRMFLHAQRLAFRHPVTKKWFVCEAPLDPSLDAMLRQFSVTRQPSR